MEDRLEAIILKLHKAALDSSQTLQDRFRALQQAQKLRDRLRDLNARSFRRRSARLQDALTELEEVSAAVEEDLEGIDSLADKLNGVAGLLASIDTVLAV